MARTLKPTALYKSQRFQGPVIMVVDEELGVPIGGEILEVYWASDAQGLNRTTTGTFDDTRYLIVKTKDIPDAVTVYLNSEELSTDDLEEGVLNSAVNIPLLVDGNGFGFGFYKILTLDEDDMAFRNAKWVEYNRHSGTYTNTTGQAIAVSISIERSSGAGEGYSAALYVDGLKVQEGYDLFTIVPANSTYQLRQARSNQPHQVDTWHELRPVGTT